MFPDDEEALIVADGAQVRGNNHALVDIGSIQNAPKLSLTTTAINHFNRYLQFQNSAHASADTLSVEDIANGELGKFADYLINHCPRIKKWNAASNYLIIIHEVLAEKIKEQPQFIKDDFEKSYSKLRKNCSDIFRARANVNREEMISHHTIGKFEVLTYINFKLFEDGDYRNNAIIAWDTQTIGRISECSDLLWHLITVDKNQQCLAIKWYRAKTATWYRMHVLISPTLPWRCCLFSLGALMAGLDIDMKDKVFSTDHLVKSTNAVLKRMESIYEADSSPTKPKSFPTYFTSHCIRATTMNFLEDDFQLKTSWIENRAGLEARKIRTSANYIRGTAKSDLYCARVLAGWETPNSGGKCPLVSSLPAQHQARFQAFVQRMFLIHLEYVKEDVLEMLAVAQVIWYGKFFLHPYFIKLKKYESHEILLVWSGYLYQTFQIINVESLRIPLEDDDELPTTFSTLSAVKESIQALQVQHHRLEQQQARGEQMSDTIASVLASVQEYQEVMMSKQDVMLELLLRPKKRTLESSEGTGINNPTRSNKKRTTLIQSQLAPPIQAINANVLANNALPEIISFHDLMMKWYVRKLYKYSPPDNDRQSRSTFNKLKRGISYLKRFMSNDPTKEFVISSNGKTDVTFAAEMAKLAASTQRNILEYLMRADIKAIWCKGDPTKPVRRDMLSKGAFWANLKRLDVIAKYESATLPMANVDDSAVIGRDDSI